MSVPADQFDDEMTHDTAEAYAHPALPVGWVWLASIVLWAVFIWGIFG